jgi:hypothetical protein
MNQSLSYGIDCDDGESHEDGDGDEGDLQVFFDYLSALDGGKAFLFEEAATIFFMMMMCMFGHKKFF